MGSHLFFPALLLICVLDTPIAEAQPQCVSNVEGRRVVSFADIHGDWDRAVAALEHAGLLKDGSWSGGNAILVQTGDVVDRGRHGKKVLNLLFAMQDAAPKQGGQVILLYGNHELMNMQGFINYVARAELRDVWGGSESGHTADWLPTGPLGRKIRDRFQVAALIGDTVYVHGGLRPPILHTYAKGLKGQAAVEALNKAAVGILEKLTPSSSLESMNSEALLGDHGPFWERDFSMKGVLCPEFLPGDGQRCTDKGDQCEPLQESLDIVGAKRMVVGHVPQEGGNVGYRCGGKLVIADTGMSYAFGTTDQAEAGVEVVARPETTTGNLTNPNLAVMYAARSEYCAQAVPTKGPLQADLVGIDESLDPLPSSTREHGRGGPIAMAHVAMIGAGAVLLLCLVFGICRVRSGRSLRANSMLNDDLEECTDIFGRDWRRFSGPIGYGSLENNCDQ